MAELWQRHRKYISVVGGGGLGALVLFLVLVWPAFGAASSAAAEAARIEADVRGTRESDRFRDSRDIDSLEQEIATIQALVYQVQKDVEFKTSDAFKLDPAEKDLLAAFAIKRDGAMSALSKEASGAGASFPETFGFEQGDDPGREAPADDTPRKMERLDLIDRASRLAIKCGVKRIESFTQGDAMEREMGPSSAGDAFIGKNCLRMTVGGAFESVLRFLHGLQQRGSYAAVLECALEKTGNDQDTDYVKATVTFSALHVDMAAKKPAPDEEEEGPKKVKKPPRGQWR